jgi:hypothetical protein
MSQKRGAKHIIMKQSLRFREIFYIDILNQEAVVLTACMALSRFCHADTKSITNGIVDYHLMESLFVWKLF